MLHGFFEQEKEVKEKRKKGFVLLMQGGLQGNTGKCFHKTNQWASIAAARSNKARRGFLGKQRLCLLHFCLFTLTHELHYSLYKQAMGMVSHGQLYFFFIIKSYFLVITPAQ